jgi:hypothetical protein
MDKTILFVRSDEENAKGKDLVSFHRALRVNLNQEVLCRTRLKRGMYANIVSVNRENRTIKIMFSEEKLDSHSRIVSDPMFSKVSQYLCIRTTQLIWEHDICLLGAFKYDWNRQLMTMIIHY